MKRRVKIQEIAKEYLNIKVAVKLKRDGLKKGLITDNVLKITQVYTIKEKSFFNWSNL